MYSNTPGKHKFQLSWDKEKWEDVSPVISFKTLEKGPLFLKKTNKLTNFMNFYRKIDFTCFKICGYVIFFVNRLLYFLQTANQ